MFRYVGLIWDMTSPAQTTVARNLATELRTSSDNWKAVLDNSGVTVFVSGAGRVSTVAPLSCESGVVLGTLFEGGPVICDVEPRKVSILDGPGSEAVVKSGGRALVSGYWGRYVAFLVNRECETKTCIRGPMSTLPCHLTQFGGISLIYSRLSDCLKLTGMKPTVNPKQLAVRVVTGLNRVDTSLLEEVSTVYPGECIRWRGPNYTREYYWNPAEVARTNVIESLNEATLALRNTTRHCIRAWSKCYESGVHFLSGGLDSSIVVGCMAASSQHLDLTCLHMRGRANDSDEYHFAKAAAAHSNYPLVEQEPVQSFDPKELLRFMPQAAPVNSLGWSLGMIPAARTLGKRLGAQVIFHGSYGDSLFCNHNPELACVDFASRYGIRRELFSLLLNVSAHTSRSFWELLSNAVRYGWLGSQPDPTAGLFHRQELSREELWPEIRRDPAIFEPWFNAPCELPSGKLHQAFHLSVPSDYYSPLDVPGDLEVTGVLGSQPIADICLRIPTYLHMYNGRMRALARRAFCEELPSEVASRYWKSSASKTTKSLLTSNRKFFKELLLDGHLVRDLLDRAKVEQALSGEPLKTDAHATELLDYICVEAWLTRLPSYQSREPRALAAS